MANYEVGLEKLKKAGIKAEVGTKIVITLKDGSKANAKITKLGKETAIVMSE